MLNKIKTALNTHARTARVAAVVGAASLASLASAQGGNATDESLGAAAISSANLNQMIHVGSGAVQQIITDNAKLIVVAMMPIMGFYFLQSRVRGLFG